jgi:7-keto-8-aminopelargonate synthetase-like enzyme
MAIPRSRIHTKKGLRRSLVSALKQRKHLVVLDEDMDGSIVVGCEIPLSEKQRTFQIDIQQVDEE